MRLLLTFLFVLTSLVASASHIVGGEFEILHLSGYKYRINMIIYFDVLHGNEGAKDKEAIVRLFRKWDNAFMMDVTIPLVSEESVSYTQPECSNGELVTSRLLYSITITLSPDKFNDPAGYYIAWERCCRNYTISNIYSEEPRPFSPNDPNAAGQTFYLEFPPVEKNGVPFVDSSPHLFPPLNDYACPYQPYYAEFAGVDDDGDSLVYSLVEPLNTTTSEALPTTGPAPYPLVRWRSGFSLAHIMQGTPDLKISKDGLLTVTPTLQGLFVFAVKCEEYRDHQKIGELRRDFQMLVVDACSDSDPPQILGKKSTDPAFTYDNNMSVNFASGLADADRCVEVQISDPDALKPQDNFTEQVKIKAVPIGFHADVTDILPTVTNATLTNGSVATFEICFPECPIGGRTSYTIGIVAYDDACSLPLRDTLKIAVTVQPPPNSPAYFTTPKHVNATLNEGDQQQWSLAAHDDEGEHLEVHVFPIGFKLDEAGMTFNVLTQQPGAMTAELLWDARCDIYNFTIKTDYDLMVLVDDVDTCSIANPDTTYFKLHVIIPNNSPPVIDTDLTPDPAETVVSGIARRVYDNLSFQVTGMDPDNDFLELEMEGEGFDPSVYSIQFLPVTGTGHVASLFNWDIGCDKINPAVRKDYTFLFKLVDKVNKCRFYNADTLEVKVTILPAENAQPVLVVSSQTATPVTNNIVSSVLGDAIRLTLVGTDADVSPDDLIRIEMISATGNVPPDGYTFNPVEGHHRIETEFLWNPDCAIFKDGVYQNQYHFKFRVYDDRCSNPMADTVSLEMNVRDIDDPAGQFRPMNIVSANGDGCNDYFALEGFDAGAPSCPLDPNYVPLPPDNCRRHFEFVKIMDRWGKQMFESHARNFRWYPNDTASGVYYYYLQYTDRSYKGAVTVRH